ncbi:MAG TPA: hypothetical protein VF529_05930 [Solirubrobacteraceae bacterium]
MNPRDAARALAFGRIAFGAAAVLAPRLAAGGWVGADGRTSGATVLTRALGARDVLMGAMVLHTIDNPEVAPRWLSATAACDAVDLAATAATRDDLPTAKATMGMLVAGTGAAAGLALSRAVAATA